MYYKQTGETITEFIDRLCIIYSHNKACVCGKLDPMARGLTKVLFDKDTKQMHKYLNSIKTYEFQLMPGISTKSDDIMGDITHVKSIDSCDITKIKEFMVHYKSIKEQKFHPISAIHIKKNGVRKPLWHWNKMNMIEHGDLPSKKVSIMSMELINCGYINYRHYLDQVKSNLQMLSDESFKIFNGEDLLRQWNETSNSFDENIYTMKFKLTVSSGFYVRMIAYDIKKELGIPVHVFDINRVDVK